MDAAQITRAVQSSKGLIWVLIPSLRMCFLSCDLEQSGSLVINCVDSRGQALEAITKTHLWSVSPVSPSSSSGFQGSDIAHPGK